MAEFFAEVWTHLTSWWSGMLIGLGLVGSFTAWLLTLQRLRKVNLEIKNLKEEQKAKGKTIVIPTMDEVERYGRYYNLNLPELEDSNIILLGWGHSTWLDKVGCVWRGIFLLFVVTMWIASLAHAVAIAIVGISLYQNAILIFRWRSRRIHYSEEVKRRWQES